MSEYIKMDALKQSIREKFDGLIERIEINSVINAQPTADVPQWIPCDERLPEMSKYEEGQNYLVTVLDKSFSTEQLRVEIRQGFIDGFWKGYYEKDLTILAWMPLPNPWKGKKDGCN